MCALFAVYRKAVLSADFNVTLEVQHTFGMLIRCVNADANGGHLFAILDVVANLEICIRGFVIEIIYIIAYVE